MKVFIVLALFTVASCQDCTKGTKFDQANIMVQQAILINQTIAVLQAMAQSNATGTTGSVDIISYINDNLGAMADMMEAEGQRLNDSGVPVIKGVFQNIYDNVYEWGGDTALTIDLPYYLALNATDGQMALANFALHSKGLRWRCELDAERRTVCPTVCKDEQGGWDDWNAQVAQVIAALTAVVPKLKAKNSSFWAHQHQMMLNYIASGVPQINDQIKAEPSSGKRALILCNLAENLELLNVIALSADLHQNKS